MIFQIFNTEKLSHCSRRLERRYLERRNGRYFALFYKIRRLLGPITSKWMKIHSHCQRQRC